jgi:hypothetical protein
MINGTQIDSKNLMTHVVQQLDAAFACMCHSKQKVQHNPDIIICCKSYYALRSIIKNAYCVFDKLKLKLAYSKSL